MAAQLATTAPPAVRPGQAKYENHRQSIAIVGRISFFLDQGLTDLKVVSGLRVHPYTDPQTSCGV